MYGYTNPMRTEPTRQHIARLVTQVLKAENL